MTTGEMTNPWADKDPLPLGPTEAELIEAQCQRDSAALLKELAPQELTRKIARELIMRERLRARGLV